MNNFKSNWKIWPVLLLILFLLAFSFGCGQNVSQQTTTGNTSSTSYQTKNVIIVIMDGVRYSETFGDESHQNIPHIWNDLRPLGSTYTNFYNYGHTVTAPGHSTLLSGVYQYIANNGQERPHTPTIFEYYRQQGNIPLEKCWVVTQKANLKSINYSTDENYGEKYRAKIDSPGIKIEEKKANGVYLDKDINAKNGKKVPRNDDDTWELAQKAMDKDHPSLLMINFGETDSFAHNKGWKAYLGAIKHTDDLIYKLWQKIQADAYYKDKTTLIIANDHGRHLNGISNGYISHGDDCEGCQHVMLMVIGPDVKRDTIIETKREFTDMAPTIGKLMNISISASQGEVMTEMLK